MDVTPFGRYQLVELLGRGDMGEVWRAFDTVADRVVAVKVLAAHLASDPTFEEGFRREAFAAARLNSPHVVPINDFGEINGRLYVDMRLIEGRDLERLLVEGPLHPVRAVRIIEQVARALHDAHTVGLIHRDVRSANILLDEDDFAYLVDFGIARAAPEADARADVYGLACVLYESLTGHRPIPGIGLENSVAEQFTAASPPPSTVNPRVPAKLDAVVAIGMAREPDERYPTTMELARAARDAVRPPRQRPSAPSQSQSPAQTGERAGVRVPPTVPSEPTRRVTGVEPAAVTPYGRQANFPDHAPHEGSAGQHRASTASTSRPRWHRQAAVISAGIATIAVIAAATIVLSNHDSNGSQSPSVAASSVSTTAAPSSGPATPAPAPAGDGLAAEFQQFAGGLNADVGVVFQAVGDRAAPPVSLGGWQKGPAWSTIKVPLSIAALRESPSSVSDDMRAAITRSDNAAAESIWRGLGTPDVAKKKVEDVLSAAGAPTTVQSQRVRPEFSAFGQTDWSLTDQARFLSSAVCNGADAPIFTLMGQVEADQRWGLGDFANAQIKGGWGPSTDGKYLVRQIGVVTTPAGMTAVAMAAEPTSGSFGDGTNVVTKLANWLKEHQTALPAGQCSSGGSSSGGSSAEGSSAVGGSAAGSPSVGSSTEASPSVGSPSLGSAPVTGRP